MALSIEERKRRQKIAVEKYRAKNAEKVKQWKKDEYQRNKETYQKNSKEYNKTHRNEINESKRRYYSIPENRERKNENARNYDRKIREDLIDLLGGICVNPDCPCKNIQLPKQALAVEHKNGNGRKDRARFNDAYSFYKYYLNRPELAKELLQVMCHICNHMKRYSNGEGCYVAPTPQISLTV